MNWNLLTIVILILFIGYLVVLPRKPPGKEDFNPEVSWKLVNEGGVLLDVRSAREYNSGHTQGAINIPHSQILENRSILSTLTGGDLSKPIVVYCASGRRSGLAKKDLQKLGYTKIVNHGSFSSWKK